MEDADYRIDPELISTKPQVWRGAFAATDLERLEDALADEGGELRYEITATQDRQRRKTLLCIIEGFVFLICQNTLEAFRHEISIKDRLILVDDESGLPPVEEESEDEDYVVADEPLDVRDLVEDAVLLSLPMIPRKPGSEAAGKRESRDEEPRTSPFAALASLKKSKR
jgi:uncharacterized protein